jgi:hypothetical protein
VHWLVKIIEIPLHDLKVGVWCTMTALRIIGHFFLEPDFVEMCNTYPGTIFEHLSDDDGT